MRLSAKLLCAAASVAAFAGATPASAQTVGRIVAFGDSYADDGNLFELLGIPRPAVYPNGRFSDQTNFVDTMALLLHVPVDNFAIGGAFTNNGNINGPGIPGFVTEYQSFLGGGGPAAFPRVSGTFGPQDLLVVSIGGNDARAYEKSLGNTPTPAQIATLLAGVPGQSQLKVAEATAGLTALVNAGARNITFLAGDVGRLPEVNGLPIAPVGSAYASAFNSGMQASLANFAAQGVIVNYLDLNKIGDVVQANLSAFGLISAGACPVACVTTDPSLLDKYLFYVDQLHLTSKGFSIVGRYAVRQLAAPLTFSAQTDLGLSSANGFGQLMSGRIDLGGDPEHPLSFYLVGTAGSHDVGPSITNSPYDYRSAGAAGGVQYDFSSGLLGVAVSYSEPKAEVTDRTARTRAQAWHVGAYGQIEMGGAFVDAYAGIGRFDYRFRRDAVIDQIAANTNGTSIVAGGEAGYLFDLGSAKAGPVVGVQYARAKLDPYTEAGDPVLTLNVGAQRESQFVGFAGAELDYETQIGGLSMKPFGKLLAEKELDGSHAPVRYAGTASPTIVNTFRFQPNSDDVYGRVEAGVSLGLGGGLALQAQVSATVEHPQHDEVSGSVGLKVGF
jgi:outer membrane lipase/esterase